MVERDRRPSRARDPYAPGLLRPAGRAVSHRRSSCPRRQHRRFDLGAYAHGTGAAAAAGRMVEHMRVWVDAGCPPPLLYVHPAHAPDGDLPAGEVLDKRHSRLVLAFTPREKGTP